MARVVAVLLGIRPRARHHHHPVLRVVAADHPDGVPRDQGRRGRRVHLGRRGDGVPLRQGQLRRLPRHPATRSFDRRRGHAPTKSRRGRRGSWHDPRRTGSCPTSTSRWARPRRTSPSSSGVTRAGAWTSSASGRRTSPRRPSRTASGRARSRPVTLPDGTVVATDDGPRPGVTLRGGRRRCKPVFRPDGTVTAGNCCPLNDGAAAVVVMSDSEGDRARPHPAGPDRLHRRHRAVAGDHGPRPGRGVPAGAGAGPA